ncbi:MAG: membrane protein [Phycisphaerales bacterium]|jgi:membrane protein
MAAMRLHRTQIPRMAAALAYRTLFGLIPVMAISLIVFGQLLNDNQLKSGVQRSLEFFQLDKIVLEEQQLEPQRFEEMPADLAGPPAPLPLTGGVDRLDQLVTDLVQRAGTSIAQIPNTRIAIVSLLILIYAAISMLVEIEKAFNHIYHAHSGRKWIRRFFLYWTALTLGVAMLVATFAVGEWVKTYAVSLAGSTGYLAAVIGFVMTVFISTLLFFTAYMTMTNTRVRWRSAIAGAMVAAIIWELGKWGFRSYIEFSVGYARVYGSLAVLPLFLLWVYVTWLIVLFGLQVAYTLQTIREWDDEDAADTPGLIDPAVALAVASAVASRFSSGKLATRDIVADACGLTDRVTSAILETFEAQGLVHLVERNNREGYALAAPPETLLASRVLEAAAPMIREARGTERPPVLDRLVAARVEALGDLTLADLMPKPGAAPSVDSRASTLQD